MKQADHGCTFQWKWALHDMNPNTLLCHTQNTIQKCIRWIPKYLPISFYLCWHNKLLLFQRSIYNSVEMLSASISCVQRKYCVCIYYYFRAVVFFSFPCLLNDFMTYPSQIKCDVHNASTRRSSHFKYSSEFRCGFFSGGARYILITDCFVVYSIVDVSQNYSA